MLHPTADVRTAAGLTQFLHRDHLSSVRAVSDVAGAATRVSTYAPYGKQVETVLVPLSAAESKGWIGERTDPETGLTYLNARYYDAELGRFLSPDWWSQDYPGLGTNRYMLLHWQEGEAHMLRQCHFGRTTCRVDGCWVERKLWVSDSEIALACTCC